MTATTTTGRSTTVPTPILSVDDLHVRYGESPVHVLYTDYSRSKGQSVWNAVNILAELIWR